MSIARLTVLAISFLVLCLAANACAPGDYASRAAEECQEILDETIPAVIDEIERRCERQIQDAVDAFGSDLDQAIADALHAAEVELFTRLGCTPVETVAGWDCTGTEICGGI